VPNTLSSKTPLLTSECKGNQPAVAYRLANSVLGRGVYLLELVNGSAVQSGLPVTPLNPQGRIGVDKSGPPWGSAHLHPVWCAEGGLAGSAVIGIDPLFTLTTVGQFYRVRADFFMRHFARGPKVPYSRAYFQLSAATITGGTATIDIIMENTNDSKIGASFASAVSPTALSGTLPFTTCKPGQNQATIKIQLASLSGGSTGCRITSMSLNQIVRNSH
jgi:hypothetical protein